MEEQATTPQAVGHQHGAQVQKHPMAVIMALVVQAALVTMHSQQDHALHTERALHLGPLLGVALAVVWDLVRHQQAAHMMLLHQLFQHLLQVALMQEVTRHMG